jgi:hypothetical protein
MRLSKRPKPHTLDVAEALGFNKTRVAEIGVGSHKPNMGRGGVPMPDSMYVIDELNVKTKKGIGIGESIKQNKNTEKTSWSDII